jgi:hypothetical protein
MRLGQASAWPVPQGPVCGPAMLGPITRAFIIIFLLDNETDNMLFASTIFFF